MGRIVMKAVTPMWALALTRHVVVFLTLGLGMAAAPSFAAAQVDLVLNMTDAPDPVPAGGNITYSTTVTNDGVTTATGNTFMISVPASATYQGVSGTGLTCSGMTVGAVGPGTVTCTLPDLAFSATSAFSVLLGTFASGSVSITASVASTQADAQPANNSRMELTTVVAGADVALLLTAPGSASSGSSYSYDLSISNAGPDAATALEIQFPLPTGFTRTGSLPAGCTQGGSTVTCSVAGPIASGNTLVVGSITGQVGVASGSTVTANASVAVAAGAPGGTAQDPNTSDNTVVANTNITVGSDVMIVVSRDVAGPYFVGDSINLVLTPSYTGDSPNSLTIVDNVPANYTIDSGNFNLMQNGWTCTVMGQGINCVRPSGGGAGTNQSLGTISIPVIINMAGTNITNTATISAGSPLDPVPGNNTANDGGATLLVPTADLAIGKGAPNPALVVTGIPFDYTLTTSNGGPREFFGTIVMTDTVPAGVTINSYTLNGWSCLPAAPLVGPATIDCQRTYTSGTPLNSGSSVPTVTLNATATATGALTNRGVLTTLTPNVPDTNAGNDTTSATVTSSLPGAASDVRVLKTVDLASIPAGEVLTYTVEVVNDGPVAATNVSLTDDLATLINNSVGPTGAGYVGHTITENSVPVGQFTCSTASTGSTSRRLTCAIVNLPVCTAGSNCPTVDIAIRPGGNGGTRNNSAYAVSADVADDDLSNNTGTVSSTIVARADVSASKSATPDPSPAGQEVVFVITASNNGPSQAANVTVTDTLPLGMVFVSASPSAGSCSVTPTVGTTTAVGNERVICNLGTINNGAQRTLTVRAKPTNATRGSTLTNTATVSTTTTEPASPGTTNNTATAPVTVNNPTLDVLVNKSDSPDPVAIGDTVAYTITVTNVGPSDAENVVVTDNLPASGLSYQSFTFPAGSCSTVPGVGSFGGTLVCTVARLGGSSSATLTVKMLGVAKGVFNNSVSIATDETGLGFEDNSNNTSNENTTVRTRADLEVVSKTASGPIAVRRPYNWTIRVRNNVGAGYAEADNVFVYDTLPTNMELTGTPTLSVVSGTISTSTCTGSAGSTDFSCDLGTFSNGGEVDITVPVRSLTIPSGGTHTNGANIVTSSLDPVSGNNSNTGGVTIQGSSLAGTVFRDFDAGGTPNGSDTGIAGIVMTLTGTAFDASPVTQVDTTDAGGAFSFTDLPEGSYTVQRGAVSELHLVVGQQTAGNRGGNTGTTGQISAIALGGIDTGTGYLFAYVPTARIGIAKRVNGTPVANADSSYTTTLRLVVSNPSLEDLIGVSIVDTTAGAAPGLGTFVAGGAAASLAQGQYTIQTAPSFVGACVNGSPNGAFTGDAVDGVATITSFAAGASCEIEFVVRFHPTLPLPPGGYDNQAYAQGTGSLSGQTPIDASHDGANPDPDADGDPTNNNTPTTLTPTLVADVTTTVSLPGPVNAGQPVAGTVLFSNNGPFDAASVTYQLTLTAGLSGVTFGNLPGGATATYAPGTGVVTFTGMPTALIAGQIASGNGSTPITVSYAQPPSGSSSMNSQIGTSTSQGANTAQDTDSDTVTGVGSSVVGVGKNGMISGNIVTYDVHLENLGASIANSISIPDSLDNVFGAGNYSIASAPSLTTAPAVGSLTLNASFTGTGAQADLIDQTTPLANTMAIGDIAVIRFQVLVTNVTNQGFGLGVFHNQVISTSFAPGGVGPYTDTSVAGTDPDPDTDGDPTDNTSPTIVSLGADATVGIAKAGSIAGDTVTYALKVMNTGNAVADSILVTDNLDAVFGAGNYQVLSGPTLALAPTSGSLTMNSGFTGAPPNVNLVSTASPATNTLPPGDSAVIQFRVQITNVTDQGFGLGTYHNGANTTSRGPGGSGPYGDASVDGSDVDPTADGSPGNDTSPTIISLAPEATVGAAKSAAVVGTRVTFTLLLENTGNALASAISATEDLDAVFGAGNYTLAVPPTFTTNPGTLTLNPGFTGQAGATELIDQTTPPSNTLATGSQAVIQFVVDVTNVTNQGSGFGIFSNQVATSATGPGASGPFTDLSQDGGSVDPDNDGDPTNNSTPTPVRIIPADIGVTKTGPASSQVGDTIRYTLTVTNGGPGVAENVVVQDELPSGVTFISADGGGSHANGVVTWPGFGSLASGASQSFEVVALTPTPGRWENVAKATSSTQDLNPGNNDGTADASRSTVVVAERGADLVVRKSGPAIAQAGDTIRYVITTRNNGPATADSVVVQDALPSNATFVDATRGALLDAASNTLVWPTILSLPLGSVVADTVRVIVPAEGTYVNVASASGASPDPSPSNNDGTDPNSRVTTVVSKVDIAVTKTLTSDLALGADATYNLVVTNVGSVPVAEKVTLVDTLPAALTYKGASGVNWSCMAAAQIVTCTHPGQLGPGSSTSLTLTVGVIGGAGETIVNTAHVGTPGDPDGPDNTAQTAPTMIQAVGELELEKSVSVDEVEIGDLVRYELTLRNVGDGLVTDVNIEDNLPTGFSLVNGSVQIDGVGAADPGGAPGPQLVFTVGNVAAGQTVRVGYSLRVGVGAQLGDGINRALATGSGGQAASNAVAASVGIRKGVFTDEGLILGRVWVGVADSADHSALDDSMDRIVGVPGVRIYLHDGTSAITDREGRYSFDGLQPRTWIVRVDERTLPDSMVLRPLTVRHHGTGSSKYVDLTRGEMARADFGDHFADTTLVREALDRAALGPVPEATVPSQIGGRATMVGTGTGSSWRSQSGVRPDNSNIGPRATTRTMRPFGSLTSAGAHASAQGTGLYASESMSSYFRRAGSTSGMALSGQANRRSGNAATTGPGSDNSARGRLGVLIAGLVEGRIDWRSLTNGEVLTTGIRDRFQEALIEVATERDDGTFQAGARAASFATGEFGDGYQITARFDTEKDRGRRLFNDIRPDELYDVFGDASSTLFEAQSKGRVFGAVGKGDSYLMYGDFTTASYNPSHLLGRYSRTLNGVVQQVNNDRVALRAFASRDRFQQIVDEFPAQGISGPYALSRTDGLINSERVELVTRDRTQYGVILDVVPLERFTDYTVEPFTGRLVFKRPVPSVDERLNPITIRVTYEADGGGEQYWVVGAEGQIKASDRLNVGGGMVRNDDPMGRFDLASANASIALARNTWLTGEFARSDSAGVQDGSAMRVEFTHLSSRVDLRGFYLTADSLFQNPSAGVGIGRTEMGVTGRALMTESSALFAEAIRSEDVRTDGTLNGIRVALQYRFSESFNGELGFRHASEEGVVRASTASIVPNDVNALGLRGEARLSERGSLFAEFEQDVSEQDARRLGVGATFRVRERSRLYARHELLSSLAAPYSLNTQQERNTTVLGVTADYREGQSVFSEYRVGDRVNGREAHAAIGLRNTWTIAEGVRIQTGFERVSPLADTNEAGPASGPGLAVTGGIEFSGSPLWKGSLRGELRGTENTDHFLGTAGFARRLGNDLTLLVQSSISSVLDGGAFYERTRVGLAYRGATRTSWNGLARYEHRTDDTPTGPEGPVDHRAHVVSTHVNARPADRFTARAQWAAKFATDRVAGTTVDRSAQLASGRATLDVASAVDLGVVGRTLFETGRRQLGLGVELGLRVSEDLRLGVGYNAFGFRDDDLALDEYTDRGFFIDLGWSFDERLFGLGDDGRRQGAPR